MKNKFKKSLILFVLIGLMSFIPGLNYAQSLQLIGPRKNIPVDAPADKGFSMFAVCVTGVISRSGQPTGIDYAWLKDHGWKGVVDLRVDGEYGQIGDDTKIKGFNELNFNYLALPIADGFVPSDKQAQRFLEFANNPLNQPVHVHCRAGIGRTGVMIALYRYMVQGWPIDEAINESRLFSGGMNRIQENWLKKWAQKHTKELKQTKVIEVQLGHNFTIALEANKTTGYEWQFAKPLDQSMVELMSLEYLINKTKLIGVGGKQVWILKALKIGKVNIHFKYVRPWEKNNPPVNETSFVIVIVK